MTDVITPAMLTHAGKCKVCATFALTAPMRIRGNFPDMVVGRPGATVQSVEDEGRTLVVPIAATCAKVYACKNETGGATVMFADEY